MTVQHCQVNKRCGKVAKVWVRVKWMGWGKGTGSAVQAACDDHKGKHEVIKEIKK